MILRNSKKHRERGASMVEYALLMALIVAVAVGGVRSFGYGLRDNLNNSADAVVAGVCGVGCGGG